MSVTINASTSSGLVQTADTSGIVEIQSNGSTKLTVSSTGAYGQLVSGTAQASTSGTAIDFTGIPSWVKRITVMFNGVSFNASTTPIVQLGDSGGIENSGYSGIAGSISTASNTTNAQSSTTSGMLLYSGTIGSTETIRGHITICLLGSNAWTFSGSVFSGGRATTLAGAKTLSDTLTQVRITTVNGTDTFDAGTINILYEG